MTSLSRFLTLIVLSVMATSAFAGEVRSRKYPRGVLATLDHRLSFASSANGNAHPYFMDSALDRKDLASFTDGCFYVTETQKFLSWTDQDLRSREATKALRSRSASFDALKRSMETGLKIRKLCRAHDPAKSADVIQLLTEQRTLIAELQNLIP